MRLHHEDQIFFLYTYVSSLEFYSSIFQYVSNNLTIVLFVYTIIERIHTSCNDDHLSRLHICFILHNLSPIIQLVFCLSSIIVSVNRWILNMKCLDIELILIFSR